MNSTTTMMSNVMDSWDTSEDFDVSDFMSLMDASNQVKNSY
jgi:hypothetical protein